MEEAAIATRLKFLIGELGLSDSQFADRCQISRPTLSLLLSGKNKKISDVLLTQIHNTFPDVSILWLLFGEGETFISKNSPSLFDNDSNENQIFEKRSTPDSEELNLVNVKQLENLIQIAVNKSFDTNYNTLENLILKAQEKIMPRKVSQITVYYDDSTFEIFVPENS